MTAPFEIAPALDPEPVEVAAAVLVREDGQVLLAQRPVKKVYAGFWEFPGGKVEQGESGRQALDRELHEELGIEVVRAYPWLTQVFAYPHATVRIHFFRVTEWRGVPQAREHQGLEWQRPDELRLAPMLPANTPILRALVLSDEYAISNASLVGEEAFLLALERRLAGGLRLLQLREKGMPRERLRALGRRVVALCREHGARVLVNADVSVAHEIGADGVHLTARQLVAQEERPPFAWVGASCHDAAELAKASALALDFVVLGAVRATASHPDARPLGWRQFARLVTNYALPVFAIGGLGPADRERAWRHGAHGIAMISKAWIPLAKGTRGTSAGTSLKPVAPR